MWIWSEFIGVSLGSRSFSSNVHFLHWIILDLVQCNRVGFGLSSFQRFQHFQTLDCKWTCDIHNLWRNIFTNWIQICIQICRKQSRSVHLKLIKYILPLFLHSRSCQLMLNKAEFPKATGHNLAPKLPQRKNNHFLNTRFLYD